jgi:2-(3-amino-3-carboxypropyl)histidine synthase
MKTTIFRNTAKEDENNRVKPRIKVKLNLIPDSILNNRDLNEAIKLLPYNYNFEIHKSLWRIQKEKAKYVALQFPEGLLMYSLVISDIFRKFGDVEIIILADVTYGACCVDDFTAKKLGADMMIHYGHSCLVPVNITTIAVMYVFVEIYFDPSHLIECLRELTKVTLQQHHQQDILINQCPTPIRKLALLGTVQFISILRLVEEKLKYETLLDHVIIPQVKPLSAGETLGCTSPIITGVDCFVFVADGRFHLEAAMIRNPNLMAYRYDPYAKVLTVERYDTQTMKSIRYKSIEQAREATSFGLILGTLGRQGSLKKFNRISSILKLQNKKLVQFLMAELNPIKMNAIPKSKIQVWVQVACPRLSIDWGLGFDRPILTPYELEVTFGESEWTEVYPMDYYAT